MARAGAVKIQLSVESASYSQSLDKAKQQLDQLAGGARQAGHSTVSSMQAASASLRDLNGDFTHNIRAVERFITTIPGVGAALQAAFPIVGGVAFGAMLVSVTTKVAEFYREAGMIPAKIKDSFLELSSSGQLANDQLALTNDRLAISIAKLEHRPENTLKTAIDEARVAADKFAESLDADNRKVQALLEKHQIGAFKEAFTNQGRTTVSAGTINSYDQDLSDLGHSYNDAQRRGDKGAAAAFQKQIRDKRQSAIDKYTEEISSFQAQAAESRIYGKPDENNTANLNIFKGARSLLYEQQDNEVLTSKNTDLEGQQKTLQAAKDLAAGQKEEGQKRLQAYQQQLADMKSLRSVDAGDEYNFWTSKKEALAKYPEAYREASRSAGSAYQVVLKANQEAVEHAAKVPGGFQPQLFGMNGPIIPSRTSLPVPDSTGDEDSKRFLQSDAKAAADNLRTLNESIAAQRQQSFAMREVQTQVAASEGTLSRYDIALRANSLHADQYADSMARLKEALSSVNQNTAGLSPNEQSAQRNPILAQMSSTTGSRAMQVVQDSAALDSTTLSGSFRDTLNSFVEDSRDSGAQIKQIMTESLSSVNGTLSTTLLAHSRTSREYWRNVRNGLSGSARGIGSSILNTGLQKVEGGALKTLGFGGKADGSSSSPFWVRLAGGVGLGGQSSSVPLLKTGGGILGSLARSIGGGVGTAAGADGGGDVNTATAFGTGFSNPFQGFFAGGGDVVSDRPAIIGEKGPELFVPKTAGTIIPNNQLDMGDTHHHWNIDAHGSSNQADTHATITRALQDALPHFAAITNAARTDMNRRMPSSRRI